MYKLSAYIIFVVNFFHLSSRSRYCLLSRQYSLMPGSQNLTLMDCNMSSKNAVILEVVMLPADRKSLEGILKIKASINLSGCSLCVLNSGQA